MTEKILVVEDESRIADIIKFNLERAGYLVAVSLDGEDALARAARETPDLIILDIMLPKLDGFTVCRQLRNHTSVPILMLTAKGQEEDKVKGLESGADDYVTKPFGLAELLARVRALLRRRQGEVNGAVNGQGSLSFDDLEIDLVSREIRRAGRPVPLTVLEYALLKYLAIRRGQPFTRESLLEDVWGYEHYGDIRTVDVTMRRLREKIEADPSNPVFLLTRRGIGYMFRSE